MTTDHDPGPRMRPYRWGDPERRTTLPESISGALGALGVHTPAVGPVDPSESVAPPTALPKEVRDAIESVVGSGHLRSDHAARVTHTRGWSTPDLLRLRAGYASDAPDAVAFPASHDEVLQLLETCTRERVAVVPYGGGTSVVGGLTPARARFRGVVALDLSRLDALLAVDEESRTATLQAGTPGPEVERLLGGHGLTLGHFPQSFEGASIGGYAAARSAGQASAGYGRFEDMVVGLVLATPRGTLDLGRAPRSAAGPDLRQLVLGSEGVLGVITSVTVRVRPAPGARAYEGWRFASFATGTTALRRLAQDGPLPTVVRLSDETETAVNLADPGGSLEADVPGCLMVVGYEGTSDDVEVRRAGATAVLQDAGGEPLGRGPGDAWYASRFHGPYLRDPLLDAGALVETLETATFWSRLLPLRDAVAEALSTALGAAGTPPLVLCHVSHVYETGASLYFTVACAQNEDPVRQWTTAKAAANEAIRTAGGTISHHHGVGTDHREAYAQEVGPLAVDAMLAVKDALDPGGILNPGVLLHRG